MAPRSKTAASTKSLASSARAKLRELTLELPSPFSADALCAVVSRQRNRPIVILEVDNVDADAPCGLWIETDTADYVMVAEGATKTHRDHIVLHELAHLLYDHQGALGKDYLHLSFPNLSPAVIRRALGRGSYDAHEEREAEVFASVVMELAVREQESRAVGHDREVLATLRDIFE
ncbi:hypothetical protein ACGFI9_35910 [Micromonospora sp. NPDC048930]|uniref:hypothetical protein n=1 Tax=Micromonospora sp. NPDC048930 TaxID=3364261 RepID=UPI0037239B8F